MVDDIQTTSKITQERIKQYLKEGKRFDGRAPEEYRELVIEKNISKKLSKTITLRNETIW